MKYRYNVFVPAIKQKILDTIRHDHIASVPEISQALGISKSAIQYHIQNLIETRDIELVSTPPSIKSKGRPVRHYKLSENHQPDNLAVLAGILLSQYLNSNIDTQNTDSKMIDIAHLIADSDDKKQSFINRMDACMARLSSLNYQPHWEVSRHGSRITFRNCPYARIISSHPELCRMDQLVLETMLGLPVQINHLWKDQSETKIGCEFFFSR